MKRSEINGAIDDARTFFADRGYPLPRYAGWSPQEWAAAKRDCAEIRDLALGWDGTDFGSGDFANVGRTIFTLRNGRHGDPRYPKAYAHKVMHMPEGQRSAIHHHCSKMEDICNQGPGNVMIRLWCLDKDGARADAPLTLSLSGRSLSQPAGQPLRIEPGESLCLPPLTWHQFWAEECEGDVLSTEVSTVCDDHNDNVFLEGGERFPVITEDEPARYVLCSDYGSRRQEDD